MNRDALPPTRAQDGRSGADGVDGPGSGARAAVVRVGRSLRTRTAVCRVAAAAQWASRVTCGGCPHGPMSPNGNAGMAQLCGIVQV